jgi:hypothetical protein
MNPICTDCNVEMRCTENGVTIAHVKSPNWVRKGDRMSCPNCGTEIITSLGEAYDTSFEAVVLIEDAISDAKVDVIQGAVDWMKELD